MGKRLFDLFFAGLGLLVLSPLFLILALWIKWDSPGPVLFRQERVGRYGQSFFIHKFRTMGTEAPRLGLQITVGQDSRITRSGRLLRASKLDELPQLWDVFRGAMSLVGPRPEVPRYVAHYSAAQRELVLSVRPGMTDPASLKFRDESSILASAADPEREYIEVILPAKLQIAGDYVRKANLWSDLGLIVATLRRIF